MSNSAFGIEHGEFAKFAMPKVPGGSLARLGSATGAKTSSMGASLLGGGGKRVAGPAEGSFKHTLGTKLNTAGAKMSANPGATGLGVAGVGGVGALGLGHKMFGNKNR